MVGHHLFLEPQVIDATFGNTPYKECSQGYGEMVHGVGGTIPQHLFRCCYSCHALHMMNALWQMFYADESVCPGAAAWMTPWASIKVGTGRVAQAHCLTQFIGRQGDLVTHTAMTLSCSTGNEADQFLLIPVMVTVDLPQLLPWLSGHGMTGRTSCCHERHPSL